MNTIKKSAIIIVFVALLASNVAHTMNNQPQEAAIIGNVILETIPLTSISFEDLSTDVIFLINTAMHGPLEEAGKAINALAQVNQDLNNLMNDPEYNQALTKHFAKKFKMRERYVCLALQTQAAKLYYVNTRGIFGDTPLMEEVYRINERRDARAPSFEQILQTPDLLINLKDNAGNTALMHLLSSITKHQNNPQNFSLLKNRLIMLLNAGADPEAINDAGLTPAQMAKNMNNAEIINIIKNAIKEENNIY